jgi:hypothetical protein
LIAVRQFPLDALSGLREAGLVQVFRCSSTSYAAGRDTIAQFSPFINGKSVSRGGTPDHCDPSLMKSSPLPQVP